MFVEHIMQLCQFEGMAASSKIIDLRNLLAERFPQPSYRTVRFTTGLPAIDQAIRGGLPKSAITELSSPNVSAGSALLLCALLQSAQRDGYFLALVDGRDSFDPQPLGNARLRNLLWVRCTKAFDAVKAADLLLRDGNFPLVVLDLVLNVPEELRKIPQTTWYRLQRLVVISSSAWVKVDCAIKTSSCINIFIRINRYGRTAFTTCPAHLYRPNKISIFI